MRPVLEQERLLPYRSRAHVSQPATSMSLSFICSWQLKAVRKRLSPQAYAQHAMATTYTETTAASVLISRTLCITRLHVNGVRVTWEEGHAGVGRKV